LANKKKQADEAKQPADNAAPARPGPWAALVALGGLAAVWATFLWGQLLLSRAGGKPFCGLGESTSCGALWDGDFASAVHDGTGMPVAGWGLIWGLVAFGLPLVALLRQARGQDAGAAVAGVKVVGIAGAVAIVGLLAVSFAAGGLCTLCVGTYVVVGAYAIVAFVGLKEAGFPDAGKGVGMAAAGVVAGFVVLLWPGVSTPKTAAKAGMEALKNVGKSGTGEQAHGPGDGHDHAPPTPPAGGSMADSPIAKGPGTGDPALDADLKGFIGSMPAQVQGLLSASLIAYANAPKLPSQPAPRSLWGPADAPVKIVEWTDALCGHCAQMHMTLEEITKHVPDNSFSVEPRHFPLDASCNPGVQRKNPNGPISCVAAGIQICMEGDPKAHEVAKKFFENQRSLTSVDDVYKIAEAFRPRAELQKCVESPETKKKLDDDIAYAMMTDPEGTPIVLVNGKKANGFGPMLYALIMTKGTGQNPAFAALPPPDPNAHLH
jgi:serine/threonine-protein kinase